MAEKIYLKWVSLCGGSKNIMLAILIAHPKRIFHVDHLLSTVSIFFRYRTSFLPDILTVSSGWNALPSAWNKV